MPELPEVEITKRSISKHILGKKIKSLKILNPKLRYNLNHENLNLFKNQTIKKINRRSKYILIFLIMKMFYLFI
jgi:formamidopyrimidine-DNA glycosylase